MSKTIDNNKRALSVMPGTPDYDIGYSKPPKETRFKQGQSGNPGGRPRGSKNRPKTPALNEERLKAIILEEAYRTITINDASGQTSVPMAQAVVRSLAVNAAKGNQRAQRLFTEILSTTESQNMRLHNEFLETAIEYKVGWEKVLEHRKQTGVTGPEPIPHPDDIEIDFQTGLVRINGPMTKEQKASVDFLMERKNEFLKSIEENIQLLHDNPDSKHKQDILEDIEYANKILGIIGRLKQN